MVANANAIALIWLTFEIDFDEMHTRAYTFGM